MDQKDMLLILEFKNRFASDLKKHVKRLIVFGSRARGEAAEDSDLDVVALVDAKNPDVQKKLEDIAYQVMWDHDFKPIISLKIFEESHYSKALSKGFSFYRHIEKEGIFV